MAILKNSLIVAAWTGLSRVLGFARDLLIANKLGAGMASDAFFIALQLPNLLRRLLGEGAFNVAFVPLLAREQAKGHAEAKQFAEAVLGWFVVVLVVLTALGMLAMPAIVTALVPGWVGDAAKFDLTVALGRITFPYMLMITLAAFMGAVCNTAGRFAAYAMVPSFLNLAFILGLFALPQAGLSPAYAAAWSVPLGGLAQVGYMVWEVRRAGYNLRLRLPRKHPLIRPMLMRMGPAALGVGVLQLSLVIDNFIASWVGEGAVSYLQYANRFYQLPLALIGIAVATVLLPHLSTLLGKGDKAGAGQAFQSALVACLTIATGATVGLMVLAPELMLTLLNHGAFTADAALAVAYAMMGYVLGLPAYILTKVTAPAFFANEDAKSPLKASATALGVNLLCNIGFVWVLTRMGDGNMAHVGIALATAVGGYVNAGLQWHWLRRQGVYVGAEAGLGRAITKMLGVAAAMAGALMVAKAVLPYPAEALLAWRLAWCAAMAGVGGVVFVLAIDRAGLVKLKDFVALLKRRGKGLPVDVA
ncbi:MAG: murein biosynthesis integral membrane protein MurJ [Pseudomonadaceae bacterium]|nr:murein biosynthesis integral membrane protein MurJ [Pseudomonadaceae bacterium]